MIWSEHESDPVRDELAQRPGDLVIELVLELVLGPVEVCRTPTAAGRLVGGLEELVEERELRLQELVQGGRTRVLVEWSSRRRRSARYGSNTR